MTIKIVYSLVGVLTCLISSPSDVFSQNWNDHHYDRHHQRHVIRDRHGHVISRHGGGYGDWNHFVPGYEPGQATSYYSSNGHYYYSPQRRYGAAPEQIQFGSFSHVDDLAVQLEFLLNELCLDLHYNYSHNFEFHVTYAEAYEILQVAKYIHDAEHSYDRDAIRSKLGGMDELFHHVEDDVRGWTRNHRRQIGQLGILSKMEHIELLLHQLMNDVGVHLSQGYEEAPAPEQSPQIAPPPLPIQ